jgi:hypothetical protein
MPLGSPRVGEFANGLFLAFARPGSQEDGLGAKSVMIGKTKQAYVSAETDGPLLLCSGLRVQRNGTGKRKDKPRTLAGCAFDANITLHEIEIFLDDAQAETYPVANLGF